MLVSENYKKETEWNKVKHKMWKIIMGSKSFLWQV